MKRVAVVTRRLPKRLAFAMGRAVVKQLKADSVWAIDSRSELTAFYDKVADERTALLFADKVATLRGSKVKVVSTSDVWQRIEPQEPTPLKSSVQIAGEPLPEWRERVHRGEPLFTALRRERRLTPIPACQRAAFDHWRNQQLPPLTEVA